MKPQVTINTLRKMKQNGEKISSITAYDYTFAALADAAGIHVILVGDSAAMVVQGHTTTLPITMDEMVYHTRLVSRAAKTAFVVGDMPFMSYQSSIPESITNAGRLVKEGGAAAVKLEGGASVCDTISAISKAGILVQAHIGLTPQSVHQMGGYRIQRDEDRLLEDAFKVQQAGAFSVVLEGVPASIAETISAKLYIPTIGIGAGPGCDGQVLVMHDMLGLNLGHVPKFVKKYANLAEATEKAFKSYVEEVSKGEFPGKEHCY